MRITSDQQSCFHLQLGPGKRDRDVNLPIVGYCTQQHVLTYAGISQLQVEAGAVARHERPADGWQKQSSPVEISYEGMRTTETRGKFMWRLRYDYAGEWCKKSQHDVDRRLIIVQRNRPDRSMFLAPFRFARRLETSSGTRLPRGLFRPYRLELTGVTGQPVTRVTSRR